MNSLYLAVFMGWLAGHLPPFPADGWWIARGEGMRARALAAAFLAVRAFVLVAGVRAWFGGMVLPVAAALGLMLGERVPLTRWLPRRSATHLHPATLAGIYSGLDLTLGLSWTAATLFLLWFARGDARTLRWAPLTQAFLAVAGGALTGRPDAFMILAVLAAAQQVAQAIPYFFPLAWRRWQDRWPSRTTLTRAGILALSVVLIVFYLLNLHVYRGFGQGVELIRHGTREVRVVALTFDDGPHPLWTSQILDILDAYDVPATFFVVGRHAERYPDIVERAVAAGHEIGNHTHTHRNLLGVSRSVMEAEIQRANEAIERTAGYRPVLFRPPRGAYNNTLLDVVREQRQTMVLWSVSGRDWLEIPPGEIAGTMLSRVQPGDILLLHDSGDLLGSLHGNRSNTVRALPPLIERLQAEGYTFLTVSQLLLLTQLEEEEPESSGWNGEGPLPVPELLP